MTFLAQIHFFADITLSAFVANADNRFISTCVALEWEVVMSASIPDSIPFIGKYDLPQIHNEWPRPSHLQMVV